MLRNIGVSTEVFATIWAKRRDGEDSEDAILRRVLGCAPAPVLAPSSSAVGPSKGLGIRDERNGVDFPEGFEIFRTYKHREYTAVAIGGVWVRNDNGGRFPTLNQLNSSIAAGAENVWNGNWKYRTSDGRIRSIGELRR